MAELERQGVSQQQPGAAPHAGNGSAAGGAAADPIQRLHKMSTTAGAGSQEYVAINNLAVAAAALGAGAALALAFQTWLFLILGVGGIVLAGIALYQIADSNGTQGGRLIAFGGMALAVLFSALYLAQHLRARSAQEASKKEIEAVVARVEAAWKAQDAQAVFAMLSPELQKDWPNDEFAARLKELREVAGAARSLRTNGVYQFESTGDGLFAETMLLLDIEKVPAAHRRPASFRLVPGQGWRLARYEVFNKPKPPKPGEPGGMQAMPGAG